MRIERLNASQTDDYVDNILVVWVAKHPERSGIRIIGWYRDARVYRTYQTPPEGSLREQDDLDFNVMTKVENGLSLPVNERNYIIPIASPTSGGIGSRCPVWYADREKDKSVKQSVLRYIEDVSNKKCRPGKFTPNLSQKRK